MEPIHIVQVKNHTYSFDPADWDNVVAGSNELESIQQRTSAIQEELSAVTPKMTDQFSALRLELHDVQRSLADLQHRLHAPQLKPVFAEEDRRGSPRDIRRHSDADPDVVGWRCVDQGFPLDRHDDGRGNWRPQISASWQTVGARSRDSIPRQNTTTDNEKTASSNTTTSATGADATAAFTLCL